MTCLQAITFTWFDCYKLHRDEKWQRSCTQEIGMQEQKDSRVAKVQAMNSQDTQEMYPEEMK